MKNKILFLLLMFLSQEHLFAGTPDPGTELGMKITVGLLIFTIAFLMYIIGALDGSVDAFADVYQRIKHHVIPTKEETESAQDLGHDFDGIHELDNRIPPWFNYLFGGTVIFAIMYLLNFHILDASPLMFAEYQQELVQAQLQRQILLASEPLLDESKLVALKEPSSIKNGEEIFKKYCITCHGQNGEGIVGPNLTDQYWIQGGGITNVYKTIKNGVPAKGMISWQLVFSQRQIQNIASFVLSLQGSNPPGGKKPDGQLWVEPKQVASDSTKVADKKI